MNLRSISVLLLCCGLFGCQQKTSNAVAKEKPAKIEVHPSETDIYRIVLTPKAEDRLQISTVPVQITNVPRSRLLGGEIVVPDGQRVPVTAPLTGTLMRADDHPIATAGQRVTQNEILLQLSPLLPPEREVPGAAERVQMANARASLVSTQIQADGDAKQAEARVEAAGIAKARAEKLLSDRAGSQRAVDEALAEWNLATKALEAAQERKQLLDQLTLTLETSPENVTAVSIRAPQDGMIQTVLARSGQVVNVGAALFEIVDLSRLWVRVPVYAGQIHEFDISRAASVRNLGESSEDTPAKPVEAPPTADPLAASIDLYYEVDNSDDRFRPGERVTVRVPIEGETQSLVVPRAAVLLDIHGTAWVYARSGEHEFRRHRVAVRFNTESLAVLDLGPEVGTSIVVDGAAELFGTEFGAGK